MKKTIKVCEFISEWSGLVSMWFSLFLVLLLTFEVFMRYIMERPSIFTYEISMMIGVTIAAMGLGFTHKYNGHVRVDVFWRLLSPKGRAIADLIGALVFFFPLIIILTWVSAQWTQWAFSVKEILTQSYLYPPAWPIRFVMALGYFLFLPQGIAKFIRDLYLVIRNQKI
jgi:TRAP-type mannitol/chloroaromatic compound transport system permease small subunit